MKKTFFTSIIALVLSLILLCSFPLSEASACWYDYNCLTMINGVGSWGSHNRYYWVSSSMPTQYSNMVDAAVEDWVYTTNKAGVNYSTSISLLRSTDQSTSMFEVHFTVSDAVPSGITAATEHFISGGNKVNGAAGIPTQNWVWAKITLNSSSFPGINAQNNMTKSECQLGTIAHEFGHAMGLNHCYETTANGYGGIDYHPERIMCQLGYGRSVSEPTKADLVIINHLYE